MKFLIPLSKNLCFIKPTSLRLPDDAFVITDEYMNDITIESPVSRKIVLKDVLDFIYWIDANKCFSAHPIYIIGKPLMVEYMFSIRHPKISILLYDKDIQGEKLDMLCFKNYTLESFEPSSFSESYQCKTTLLHYKYISKPHQEYEYLNLMQDIIENGHIREDRTQVGTKSIFARQMRFDISQSVPIVTTKFLPWKMVMKELLWFLQGKTNSKLLEAQGVGIWKGNSTRAFLDQRGLQDYQEGDIGPMYGYSWRHWGHPYQGCSADYTNKGYDQLAELIENLKKDPFSRRHLLTTYNPAEVKNSVLAPCHGVATMYYVEKDAEGQQHLSCHVVCRSSDTFLGLSFNIASYAMMTYIIAKKCSMKPKDLILSTGDTHIYLNHLSQVQEQLSRDPLPFPVLEVADSVRDKPFEEITMEDFNLVGYMYHPAIKAPMAV
jgi:thymidylate synthase